MADDSRISTSIEMLGAKEYSAALRNINSDLSLLSKGLKASQSAFKDLDGADALKDKLEGLNKIYDQHRQKVALIQKQLEAAKAKYGENSTQVRSLQTALYAAQTAMNNCGHEIEETSDKLDRLSQGEEDTGKNADKMGKELQKSSKQTREQGKEAEKSSGLLKKLAGGMLDVAKGAAKMAAVGTVAFMAGTAAAATKATKALIGCAGAGAAYADDMLTLAIQTGISVQTLQELNYAAPLVDVSLDTMVSSMSKLTKEMGSMDKNGVKSTDALTKMGLTIYNTSGKLKRSEDMFWEVIYALGQIENPTERDALAMEIFGKSAQELNPLIAASTQGMRDLSAEANQMGVVLSDRALKTLGEYQDSLDTFNNVWAGFKNQLGANVAGLFQPFVDDATSAVAQVNVLLSDGWQDTDADALIDILDGVWDGFVNDAKNLWVKLAPIMSRLLTSVKTYITDVLPTKLNNIGDLIKTAIGDLGTMVTGLINGIDWTAVGDLLGDLLTGAAGVFTLLVQKLPDVISGIDWSGVWDALVNLADTAAASILSIFGIDWTEVKASMSAAAGAIASFFTKAWHDISTAWQDVSTWFTDLFTGFTDWIDTAIGDVSTWATNLWGTISGAWDGVKSSVTDAFTGFTGWIDTAMGDISTWASGVWGTISAIWGDVQSGVTKAWTGFTGWIDTAIGDVSTWASGLWGTISTVWGDVKSGVTDAWTGFTGWIDTAIGDVSTWASGIWGTISSIWTGVQSGVTDAFTGFTGWIDTAIGDISTWASGVWGNIQTAWSDISGLVSESWGTLTGLIEEKTGLVSWASDQWGNIKTAWSNVTSLVSMKWSSFTDLISGKIKLKQWAKNEWDIIKGAWNTVKDFVSSSWSSFTGWIDAKLGISTWAAGVWSDIKDAWAVTSDFVSETWGSVTGWIDEKLGLSSWGETIKSSFSSIFGDAAGAIESAFSGIGKFFTDIWYDIVGTCVDALNTLIDGWNTVGDLVGLGIGRIDWTDPRNALSGERALETLTKSGAGRGGTKTAAYDISGWHEDAKAMLKDFRESMQQFFEAGAIDAQTNGREMAEKYIASFCNGAYAGNTEMIAVFTQVFNEIVGKGEETADKLEDVGEEATQSLAKGVKSRKNDLTGAVNDVMGAAKNKASGLAGGFATIGAQVAAGLANGISSGASAAVAAVQALGGNIVAAMQGKLKIGSPSKVFEWMGEMSAEGYAIGLNGGLSESLAALDQLNGLGGRSYGGSSSQGGAGGIDYNRLGDAVADALQRRGVGKASLYVDGKELGRETERGVSAENYDRQVSGYKGRGAALRALG